MVCTEHSWKRKKHAQLHLCNASLTCRVLSFHKLIYHNIDSYNYLPCKKKKKTMLAIYIYLDLEWFSRACILLGHLLGAVLTTCGLTLHNLLSVPICSAKSLCRVLLSRKLAHIRLFTYRKVYMKNRDQPLERTINAIDVCVVLCTQIRGAGLRGNWSLNLAENQPFMGDKVK